MTGVQKFVAGAVLAAALPLVASAQVAEKKSLTLDAAKKVVAAAVAEAKKDGGTGVVAVVDDGGNLIYLERLDGTFVAGANISVGKARTAATFKKPTRVFEDIIKNGRTPMVALPDFTPLQGGVPLEYDGVVIGGIGVSGAASQQRDEEVAIAGANALKDLASAAAQAPSPAAVAYFDGKTVDAAFAKGAVLFDSGQDYMVHASHRDRAGMAEVHALDTDIIYVLDGSATLVTGGSVVDPKTTAPNEIRGASIAGGETRQIRKGDVVIVPAGTPHWFKEVPGPLNYYVVKSR